MRSAARPPALVLVLLLAAPVSAVPTLLLDQRAVTADTEPPFMNPGVTKLPGVAFSPWSDLATQGGSQSCPQIPTNATSAASQESTVSPLFFEGVGAATYTLDAGNCSPASVLAHSLYRIRLTTDDDYEFDLQATLDNGNVLIENDDGTDFVVVDGFTGAFSANPVLPPDTYVVIVEVRLTDVQPIGSGFDSDSGSFDFTLELLPEPSAAPGLAFGGLLVGGLRRTRRIAPGPRAFSR